MTAMMRVPRTRGVGSGFLLILLGAWGALIPFVGPYFHFAYTPDTVWTWTWGRFFLEVVPGVAAVLGGLILMVSAFRPVAIFGAALAAAAGAWFTVGSMLGPVWASYSTLGNTAGGVPSALNPGQPTGGPLHMVAEHLSFFTALGVVVVFFAAVALGRLAVVGARDAALAGDEVAWSKPGHRATRAEKRAEDKAAADKAAAEQDGERPSRWRRLTAAR